MIRENELDYESVQALAAAIVRQAADDYATIFRGGRVGENPEKTLADIRRFLASELYGAIMEIPGDEFLRMVRVRELEKCVEALRCTVDDAGGNEIHYRVQLGRNDQRRPSVKGTLRKDLEYKVKAELRNQLVEFETWLSRETRRKPDELNSHRLPDPPARKRWKSLAELEAAMETVQLLATRSSATRYTVHAGRKMGRGGNPYRWVLPPMFSEAITAIMEEELTEMRVELKIMQRQQEGRR